MAEDAEEELDCGLGRVEVSSSYRKYKVIVGRVIIASITQQKIRSESTGTRRRSVGITAIIIALTTPTKPVIAPE
jgi:hypothetical protein